MNPFIDIVRFSPNERRYYRRSIAPSLIFIALIFVMAALIRQNRDDWPFEVLVALALSPALPMVWGMKMYIDYFVSCDEWERLVEIYGICIGVLLVGMVYLALGLLGFFKLVVLDGTLLAFGMLPAVSFAYVLGKIIGRWRHG